MNVEKLILSVKDYQAIYDASVSDHRNRDYVASLWAKIAQEMDVGMWRALLFFACFNDDNDDDNKNNSNTISDKVVVAIVIRPYISNSSTLFLA
jgi:hypothetical protein